ncbi:hypothetical protein ASC99_28775 [Kitasatospora sp. Root107]|nr:hypothetical protein ASC99_28775 [Kitasatospora sp. Root107]
MLAARDGAEHPAARQVGGGVRGHPQLGRDQQAAGERAVQLPGNAEYGVSFWHPSIIRQRTLTGVQRLICFPAKII